MQDTRVVWSRNSIGRLGEAGRLRKTTGRNRKIARNPEIQKSRDPEIQRSRNPEIQKSRNPEIQKSRDPEIQKSRNPEIQKSSRSNTEHTSPMPKAWSILDQAWGRRTCYEEAAIVGCVFDFGSVQVSLTWCECLLTKKGLERRNADLKTRMSCAFVILKRHRCVWTELQIRKQVRQGLLTCPRLEGVNRFLSR